MNMTGYDWTGLLGTLMILFAYFLLQSGRLRGNALPYQLMNAAGALGVLISFRYAFNLSAFLLEIAWLGISIYGIARSVGGRRRA